MGTGMEEVSGVDAGVLPGTIVGLGVGVAPGAVVVVGVGVMPGMIVGRIGVAPGVAVEVGEAAGSGMDEAMAAGVGESPGWPQLADCAARTRSGTARRVKPGMAYYSVTALSRWVSGSNRFVSMLCKVLQAGPQLAGEAFSGKRIRIV